MNIKEKQNQIVAEFSTTKNWEERYRKIIRLGKELPTLDEVYKTENNKVKGCQSTVWLHAYLNENNKVIYVADSDAVLVRGLVALLLNVYSGEAPNDIIETPPTFIDELGLNANLSQNRVNGLSAMIKQIKIYAMAFSAKIKMGLI